MSDIITVTGNVATPPEFKVTTGGMPVANFRLASAQRHFDRSSGSWVDDGTNWYNVSAFRGLAEHVAASVSKGEPLVVTGRLRLRAWESGGKKGVSIDIDAETLGHDLRWGTATYTKQSSAQTAASVSEPTTPPATAAAEDAWAAPGGADGTRPALHAVSETPF